MQYAKNLLSFSSICRIIRELEAQLEYERIRREELEAESDKLRSKIHSLTLEVEETRNTSLLKVTTKINVLLYNVVHYYHFEITCSDRL